MPDHPNLVFLLTDQQAIRTLGCYGNDRIETPNVDAFARESVQFERAYCAQPVCTPNRSTLLTGRYPHTTGLTENNTPLPGEERCLPELGDFEEYATAFMGKWDLGDEIFPQHGFEKWISIDDGYRDQYTRGETDERSSYASFLEANGFEPDLNGGRFSREFAASLPEEYSKPAYLADEATRFIHEHRDEPFILFVSFLEPHPPYSGPETSSTIRTTSPCHGTSITPSSTISRSGSGTSARPTAGLRRSGERSPRATGAWRASSTPTPGGSSTRSPTAASKPKRRPSSQAITAR